MSDRFDGKKEEVQCEQNDYSSGHSVVASEIPIGNKQSERVIKIHQTEGDGEAFASRAPGHVGVAPHGEVRRHHATDVDSRAQVGDVDDG